MKKLALFVVFALFTRCSQGQTDGENFTSKSEDSEEAAAFPHPRTFVGILIPVLKPDDNDTLPSVSKPAPPALALRNNSTLSYLSGPLSTRVIPVAYIMVISLGIPSNVAILCFLLTKIRKVSSAILYHSLAVSDLLLLLSLVFKTHYHLSGNDWALGEVACRLVTACFYGNLYCSAVTLACISVKRYIAVVHPFLYKGLPKRACAGWVSVGVWAVFGGAAVPQLGVRQSYWLPELNRTSCHDVLPLDRSSHVFLLCYNLALTVAGLLAPLAVSVFCFARIIAELKRSLHDWGRYIRASSLVFLIFLVCFLPAGVLHFLHYLQLELSRTEGLFGCFNLAVCLCCLHACLDPFFFLVMSNSTGSKLRLMTFKGNSMSISI